MTVVHNQGSDQYGGVHLIRPTGMNAESAISW